MVAIKLIAMKKDNRAYKQAVHDIRIELAKEGKVFITASVRQLNVFFKSED